MTPALLITACNALLDFESYKVTLGGSDTGISGNDGAPTNPGEDAGGQETSIPDDGGCVDPNGFGGRGCYRCKPETNDQILQACTNAQFEPFDNSARIQSFDPNNPTPELPTGVPERERFDAGAVAPPTDAGTAQGQCDLRKEVAPNPVMVLGATGFPMDTVAKAMGGAATLFYSEQSSCVAAANALLNNKKLSGDVLVFNGTTGASTKCTLSEPFSADVNLSALFIESCATQNGLGANPVLPGDVQDFLGPVNPVMFATPFNSAERVISAEGAYRVYGFPSSGVEPWTDETFIFRRTASSANQQTVARSLTLPIDKLRGRDSNGSSNMKAALQFYAQSQPNKTIGISSSEIVDINRDVLKTLAYQHFKQPVGFYPDSASGGTDRRNVRDGHYYLWIPLHVLVKSVAGDPVAADGNATLDQNTAKSLRDVAVRQLVLVMVSRLEPIVKSVDYFGALKRVGNVPQCAMRVTRSREGAPLQPFTPPTSCACAFEAAFPGATPPECKPCQAPTECTDPARPTCSFGYCE